MSGVFDDLLRLLSRGWVPYYGRVEGRVYEQLGCAKSRQARWMVRDGMYVCLGCGKRCSLANPAGFELLLPVTKRTRNFVYAALPAVSAHDLLTKKMLLTVPEVSFILSISDRKVYELVDEGRLERHPDLPIRVTAESVRREAARLKEG